MTRTARHSTIGIIFLGCCWLMPLVAGTASSPDNVFLSFTTHISNQVETDKHGFARASTCTEWFYKRLKERPQSPQAEGVRFSPSSKGLAIPGKIFPVSLNCHSHYPDGIKGAREDFSQTQSILTLSLTFYQFALIGDKNDDGDYNEEELEDTFRSLGLHAQLGWAPARHALALNSLFDTLHQQGQLDELIAGMSFLLDKGYRLTTHDQAALNKILG